MLIRNLIAGCMAIALLTGCASNPNPKIQYDYADCTPSGNGGGSASGGGNPVAVIVGMLVVEVVVDLSWYYGCEGVQNLDHTLFPPPMSSLHDGVYHSGDGVFSVAVPGQLSPTPAGADWLTLLERLGQEQDYLYFLPKPEGEANPGYLVVAFPKLDAITAPQTPDEFALDVRYIRDAMSRHPVSEYGHVPVELHAEDITLDGKPAMFASYSLVMGDDKVATRIFGKQQEILYLLLYVVKTPSRAAMLGIAWPRACPKCSTGSEAEIRAMDPQLKQFVESFHLADAAARN